MTKSTRARYTLEFKEEAVRLVTSGERVATVARNLGLSEQTLHNWVKAAGNGGLKSSATPIVSAEQLEISRLRTEFSRVKMERDILKKPSRTAVPPVGGETVGANMDGGGERPSAFWRRMTPLKNMVQGLVRTWVW